MPTRKSFQPVYSEILSLKWGLCLSAPNCRRSHIWLKTTRTLICTLTHICTHMHTHMHTAPFSITLLDSFLPHPSPLKKKKNMYSVDSQIIPSSILGEKYLETLFFQRGANLVWPMQWTIPLYQIITLQVWLINNSLLPNENMTPCTSLSASLCKTLNKIKLQVVAYSEIIEVTQALLFHIYNPCTFNLLIKCKNI